MAETTVPITAGSGTNIDAFSLSGGQIQQAVAIGDGQNSGRVTAVEPWAALDVFAGYATDFYDTFTGPLDTTDKWTVTGNAPTFSGGGMVMSATVSTYNAIRTKDTIRASAGFHYVANGIQLETTAATGAGRFWGLGTTASSPAAAVLAQDGIGFEIDQAAGTLLAVTYAAGARTTVATLTRPSDGALHRYGLIFRVTGAYWYIDNMQVPVASVAFPNVAVPELPALIVRQNAASFTGTPTFIDTAHLTAESSRQGMTLIDPVVGTRQARVKAASTAVAATDTPLAVGLHPSSPTPMPAQFQVEATLTTTTATTQTVTFAALTAAQIAQIDAGSVDVFVANVGTGQNVTGINLSSTDTIGGVTATIPHPNDATNYNQYLSRTSGVIASGTVGVMTYHLGLGLLRNITVALTWASAPTASQVVTVRLVFHGATQPGMVLMDAASNNPLGLKSDGAGSADLKPLLPVGGRTPGSGAAAIAHNFQTSDLGALAVHPGGALTAGVASMNIGPVPAAGAGRVVLAAATAAVASSASLIAAPGAGLSTYVTDLLVANAGTAGELVSLTNGLAVAVASAALDVFCPAGANVAVSLVTPVKMTAATAVGYLTSAATAGSTLTITARFYTAP